MLQLADGIELPDSIEVVHGSTRQRQHCPILPLDRKLAKKSIDVGWWTAHPDIPRPLLLGEYDRTWEWHKVLGLLRTKVGRAGFAWAAIQAGQVEGASRVEGAILYQLGRESELEADQATLFVYLLATAPWNRTWLKQPRDFIGVGTGLLSIAVYHSYQFGLGGRVTLEAISEADLIDWYTRIGFELASADEFGNQLLELRPHAAQPIIEQMLDSL
jgi:hypothetical protein